MIEDFYSRDTSTRRYHNSPSSPRLDSIYFQIHQMIELVYVNEVPRASWNYWAKPWPWERLLCYETTDYADASEDVFCLSTWRRCIRSEVDLDLSSLSIKEFSGEVEMDLEAVEVHIHRIGLCIFVIFDDDVPYVIRKSIPSDLIRHVIALGDEEGGLLTRSCRYSDSSIR